MNYAANSTIIYTRNPTLCPLQIAKNLTSLAWSELDH